MTEIKFRDLSAWLKALVIMGWIMAGTYAFYFFVGFIAAV